MTGTMLLALLFAAPLFSEGGNLLANPGFEDTAAGDPVRWKAFLMPQEGAYARLDRAGLEGQYAAVLHTPLPYDREPTNNWSQNVVEDLAGRRLVLRGHIRTREATEAAIWVQCWQKRPLRPLKVVNTSTEAPMYGTREWEEVTAAFDVPRGTDFLTVRCVLLGTGTAWFDDITLEEEGEEAAADESGPGAEDETKPGAPFRIKVTGPDGVEYPEVTVGAPADDGKPAAAGDVAALMAVLEDEIARLGEANAELAAALADIRADNADLMDEVLSLRLELRERLERTSAEPPRGPAVVVPVDPPKLPAMLAPAEGRKD